MIAYDRVYVTNLPSFYKINLFNKIAERQHLMVIFLEESDPERNADYYEGERRFDYQSLGHFNATRRFMKFLGLMRSITYEKIIVGGFDYPEYWAVAMVNPKARNGIALESSILESTVTGMKGLLKRLFFTRISTAYVSGKAQAELAVALGFSGSMKITKGVGIFNVVMPPEYHPKECITNFIYVGRLSPEKNLESLIRTFNRLPGLTLNIVGYGPQERALKSMAGRNIVFHGPIDNKRLSEYYARNDVLILPSLSEPWGVVVEEALNNGLPVIVSDKVGCALELVRDHKHGIVYSLAEKDGLLHAITAMTDPVNYNEIRKHVCRMDFAQAAEEQTNCYL